MRSTFRVKFKSSRLLSNKARSSASKFNKLYWIRRNTKCFTSNSCLVSNSWLKSLRSWIIFWKPRTMNLKVLECRVDETMIICSHKWEHMRRSSKITSRAKLRLLLKLKDWTESWVKLLRGWRVIWGSKMMSSIGWHRSLTLSRWHFKTHRNSRSMRQEPSNRVRRSLIWTRS